MHLLDVAAVFLVLLMVGVEFSVAAFVDPSVSRLDLKAQPAMLSHFAAVLGRVMPFWYVATLLLLGADTWIYRNKPEFPTLLAASILWLLASLGSIVFLVPLNNRVAAVSTDWQAAHQLWDRRHRVRVAVLVVAALLFTYAVVR